MESDLNSTDAENRPDESTETRSQVERRPLLKALSVGATLSLGGNFAATATAAEQDDARIDALYGYSVTDAAEVPEHLRPDRTVSLEVVPPDPEAGTAPLFFFEPSGLSVSPGDIVQFTFASPDHTVTAYHPANGFQRRVPENVPAFSSPVVNVGGAWLYRFEKEGVYDVYCGPHHVFGMVGRIVVGDLSEDSIPGYVETFEGSDNPPILAPYSRTMLEGELDGFSDRNENSEWVWLTPTDVLGADALDPMRIQEAGSVPFSEVREELRGGGEQTTAG